MTMRSPFLYYGLFRAEVRRDKVLYFTISFDNVKNGRENYETNVRGKEVLV